MNDRLTGAPRGTGEDLTASARRWSVAMVATVSVWMVLVIVAIVAAGAVQPAPARPIVQQVRVSGAQPASSTDYLSVSPGVKPGPDGQLHDAYSQTTFDVHAGVPVRLVIDNTDNVPHGIVAPAAGVDITARPGTHTYVLLVKKPGVYVWHCSYPCDPYSMMHMGYMMGTIVAE